MTRPPLPPPLTGDGTLDGGPPGGPYRVCFVCTGNICRSPMAEVVLGSMAAGLALPGGGALGDRLAVSSAGTGPWHEGEPMDVRALAALEAAGYAGGGHRARQFATSWFTEIDLLVALDRRHHGTLRSLAGSPAVERRLTLLRSFDPGAGGSPDLPDPYYGDAGDFARCLAMVEAGCRGLSAALAERLSPPEDGPRRDGPPRSSGRGRHQGAHGGR